MRKLIVLLLFPLVSFSQNNIGIGTNSPNASALLDITSSNKGLLIPRFTTSNRNASITSPAKGLLVYDSTLQTFVFHNGTNWIELINANNNLWLKNGTSIYTNAVNTGIGTSAPGFSLHVVNNNAQDGGWAQGIMVENSITDSASVGEAAISFRNGAFTPGKQWTIGLNQSSPLSFSFGSSFVAGNTRMAIDTVGRVGLGTITPDSSAQLHMNSTNKGFILPRMTSAQRKAIVNPALGLFVFDIDKHSLYMYDGIAWVAFAAQAPGFVPIAVRSVDTIPQDYLDIGNCVAVDGELAVTRSNTYQVNGLLAVGCVLVYKKNGGRWDYVQQIIPDVVKAGTYFGNSLALSGNILVVGSPYWDGNFANKGKVWYYQWDGTAFQFLDSLVISPGSDGAYFGFSVALRGNTLVVGAPEEDTNGASAGGIYVYTFNSTTQRFGNRVRLSPPNASAGDNLGYSVDVDGAYVIASAPFRDFGSGLNKGIVHVWTGSGTSWGYQDSCTFASSTTPYTRLGLYASISGSNIVAGANNFFTSTENSGSAIYFRRSGSQWNKIQEIQSKDGSNNAVVPYVSTRGNYLLIGNAYEDNLSSTNIGNVWVYELENGLWVEKRRIYNYTASDASQRWPSSQAFDGTTIMIGSYTYNNRQGAVYFTTVTD